MFIHTENETVHGTENHATEWKAVARINGRNITGTGKTEALALAGLACVMGERLELALDHMKNLMQ